MKAMVRILKDGRILAGGLMALWLGLAASPAARTEGGPAGTLDPTFDIKTGFGHTGGSWPGNEIRAMAVQPDGKLVVAGFFNHFQGMECAGLARLNRDGSLDKTFLPKIEGETVAAMLPMEDGRFLVGGKFTQINGISCPGLARLKGDGSVDESFLAGQDFYDVKALAWQSDGKILICQSNLLMRLLSNGALDAGFTVVPYITWNVTVTVQPDDKILINGLERRNPDGSSDASFQSANTNRYDTPAVLALKDGRILLGGLFPGNRMGDMWPYASLKCLKPDGTLAPDFKQDTMAEISPYCEGEVLCLAQQPDGKILAGGRFIAVNGQRHPGLFRLHPDGTLDEDFQPEMEVNGWCEDDQLISKLLLDGNHLYVGGYMTKINGLARGNLARLFVTRTEAPAVIRFTSADVAASEAAGQISIQVRREGTEDAVEAHITTGYWWGESALTNEDYTLISALVTFAPGETNKTISIPLVQDQKVEASEQFAVILQDPGGYAVLGYPQTTVVTILDQESANTPGSVDTNFAAGYEKVDYYPGVQGILPFSDGAMLVRGLFQQRDVTIFRVLDRLLADGTKDPSFAVQLDGDVLDFAADAAGKTIYIAGAFTNVNGVPQRALARLDGKGALDAGFRVAVDGVVGRLALTASGQLIIFGNFTLVNGTSCSRLARLNSDGSLDATFAAETAPRWNGTWTQVGELPRLVAQTDGKLLLAGCGPDNAYGLKSNLMRLNPDGAIDKTFKIEGYADMTYVQTAMVEPDGHILVGGYCGEVTSNPHCLIRLNSDGSLDPSFESAYSGSVIGLARQADAKILVLGYVNSGTGLAHRSVARLLPNGRLDLGFFVGAVDDYIGEVLALQADGKVLVGGRFLSFNGHPLPYLVRLNGDEFIRTNRLAGALTLDAPYYRTSRNVTNVSVVVQRLWGTQGAVEINYATEDGSAKAGVDYQAMTGRLHFNDGDSTPQTIAIPLLKAGMPSLWGAFALRLSQPNNGAAFGPIASATIELADQGPMVRFGIRDTYTREDQGVLRVVIYCDGHPNQAVKVEYRTIDGTAKDGEDYTGNSGTLEFNPGSDHLRIIEIPIINDTRPENHEDFMVQLVSATGAALTPNYTNLVVNITEDDDHIYGTGKVDTHFRPWPGAMGVVYAVSLQKRNQILAGGEFYRFSEYTRWGLARLLPDGQMDDRFAPSLQSESGPPVIVQALAVQPDDQVLVAGRFSRANGQACQGLVRLNADGWLDAAFSAGEWLQGGATNQAATLVLQPDGKILAGGEFQSVNGVSRSGMVRLLANGQVDASFNPGAGAGGVSEPWVRTLALQSDQKIVAGGNFTTFDGQVRMRLARLDANGTLDASFNPQFDDEVRAVAIQRDGRIVVGGGFSQVNGKPAKQMARLQPDGSLDASFDSGAGLGGATARLHALLMLPDGKILIGGDFETYNGQPSRAIARLNPDGGLDSQFDTSAVMGGEHPIIYSMAVQDNGQVVIGGQFGLVGGLGFGSIARLNGDGAASFALPYCRAEAGVGFRLNLNLVPDRSFFMQTSTNLVDWETLFTNAAPNDLHEWVDTNAWQHPQRYYRVQTLPKR